MTIKNVKDMFSLQECKEDLLRWKSSLADKTHIDRKETDTIISLIEEPSLNNKDKIVFLVGNAGSGKSVVMHDVLSKVRKAYESQRRQAYLHKMRL